MVSPSAGSVVLVSFPFSDLSASKLRPAVVIASGGRDDWILCQVTSNPYADANAIEISDVDFASGSLQRVSFVRPGKLFTSNVSPIRNRCPVTHSHFTFSSEGGDSTTNHVIVFGCIATRTRTLYSRSSSYSIARASFSRIIALFVRPV